MRRFVLVVALVLARSAQAQVSDAELDAHARARREFDACMESRLAAMREAMALDEDARNAAMRAIPLCLEPALLPALPAPADGPAAPPSLAEPRSFEPVRPVQVKRSYREYIVAANVGGALVTGVGLAVDPRVAIAGAAMFAVASPAVHYYFGAKDAVAPSIALHGIGAAVAIFAAATLHKPKCDPDTDFACIGNAFDSVEYGLKTTLGVAVGTILITAVDAQFLAKPRDVYITPTFMPSQGTAGVSLGGTF